MASPECVLTISSVLLTIAGQFSSPVDIAAAGSCSWVNDIHGPTGALFQFYYNSMVSSVYLEFPIPGT